MTKPLVIVESPTKAKTIGAFLGSKYNVTSSYGHVRDLPNNAAEIPEKVKKEKWSRLGVNVDQDFEPLYIIPDQKKKRVQELKSLLKESNQLLLATDEDREGESISWHLLEVLKPNVPVKRLVFHEITKDAIQHAIDHARDVDLNLVKAQETRRIIDRLFGYSVSPLLWKKMKPRLSAGRVQSVATRLLVERERARIAFRSAEYWDLTGDFKKKEGSKFSAELFSVGGKRIAEGKDFDPNTGKLSAENVLLLNEKAAKDLSSRLTNAEAKVTSVESKPFTSKPSAPFTTSTLQQEASRKYNFSARRTMQVAQTLYENGFITYMRTDSTSLSEEALNGARNLIAKEYGKEHLPDSPRLYQTKVKNAQEAHEAIRPAGSDFVNIATVNQKLGPEAGKLYELIWKRTVASQMKDAQGTRILVQIGVDDALFKTSGKVIDYPGYLRAYVEGSDDPEADLENQEKILPPLAVGEVLNVDKIDALQHFTKPPARYTEGSLIKELERLGIGRPSTWATIVDVVLQRDYAFKKGSALVPTFLAMAVTNLMESYFTDLVDYKFTASLEDDLDSIARGEANNLKYLNKFYFGNGHPGLKGLVEQGAETIDPRIVCGLPLGKTDKGEDVEVRIGRYGPFISNGTVRASTPDLMPPDELTLEQALQVLTEAEKGPQALGLDSSTDKPVYVKVGRFGPYVQLGENDDEEKPKMASLLAGMLPETVTLDIALQLLSLPRTLGKNPENNEDILAANGRYGPYIKCGTDNRTLPADWSPLTVTLEQAIELLKQPKRRGRQATPAAPLKVVGTHPVSQAELTVKSGRFGPYVTDGKINASLPRGMNIESLTVEDAVNLLNARAAKIEAEEASGETKTKKKRTKKTKAKKEE
jgi:DNA topoisomerase-1